MNHINKKVPEQYQKSMNGLDQVLRMAFNIAITDSINQANKLQALSIISDIYRYQLDLSTNVGVISETELFDCDFEGVATANKAAINTVLFFIKRGYEVYV